jgi:hypothetical protein
MKRTAANVLWFIARIAERASIALCKLDYACTQRAADLYHGSGGRP